MKEIINKVLNLVSSDSRTNIILEFELDKDYKSLEIRCKYSPKIVEDLALAKAQIEAVLDAQVPEEYKNKSESWESFLPLWNFATLSIDFEDKYIGCAHRHAPEQTHIISEEFSSFGFWPQKPLKGKWRVVINVHSISTEVVPYHIVITGTEEEDV